MPGLINRCYRQLRPGGMLIIGNFSPLNPDRYFMDHILEPVWEIENLAKKLLGDCRIHSDDRDLTLIFSQTSFGANIEVIAKDLGNLFAIARRPV
ncbi:MAG: hypothetical protein GY874_01195 [Desulfobacteraceae bacterium]|nr:hypothetical protein [Desulfobacteraceae bacterium]